MQLEDHAREVAVNRGVQWNDMATGNQNLLLSAFLQRPLTKDEIYENKKAWLFPSIRAILVRNPYWQDIFTLLAYGASVKSLCSALHAKCPPSSLNYACNICHLANEGSERGLCKSGCCTVGGVLPRRSHCSASRGSVEDMTKTRTANTTDPWALMAHFFLRKPTPPREHAREPSACAHFHRLCPCLKRAKLISNIPVNCRR